MIWIDRSDFGDDNIDNTDSLENDDVIIILFYGWWWLWWCFLGDDVPAQDLVNPPAFSDLSIDPLIMNQLYTKERLLSLFSRIGYSFDDNLGE